MSEFPCPHCSESNQPGAVDCANCSRYMVVARLTSLGRGVLAKGRCFDLLPTSACIGREASNDVVIDSDFVALRQAELRYLDNGFSVYNVGEPSRCFVNGNAVPEGGVGLRDGDHVKIGVDEFGFDMFLGHLATDSASPHVHSQSDAVFLQALSQLLLRVNACDTLMEVFQEVLDAVIEVSGLERALGYLPQRTDEDFERVVTRVQGARDLSSEDIELGYPVYNQILETAMSETYAIIAPDIVAGEFEDPDNVGYKGLICIPLCVYDDVAGMPKVRGVIYADSLHFSGKSHDYAAPTLYIIGQIMTMAILDDDRASENLDHALEQIGRLKNQIVGDTNIGVQSKMPLVKFINRLTDSLENPDEAETEIEGM